MKEKQPAGESRGGTNMGSSESLSKSCQQETETQGLQNASLSEDYWIDMLRTDTNETASQAEEMNSFLFHNAQTVQPAHFVQPDAAAGYVAPAAAAPMAPPASQHPAPVPPVPQVPPVPPVQQQVLLSISVPDGVVAGHSTGPWSTSWLLRGWQACSNV